MIRSAKGPANLSPVSDSPLAQREPHQSFQWCWHCLLLKSSWHQFTWGMSLKFSFPRTKAHQNRASALALVFPTTQITPAGVPGCPCLPSLPAAGNPWVCSSDRQKVSHPLPFSHLENAAGVHVSYKEAVKSPATHFLLLINRFLALTML